MTTPRSPASLLRGVLDGVLLELGAAGSGARADLDDALAALTAWVAAPPGDAGHLAHLERATAAVTRAIAALGDAADTRHTAQTLVEVEARMRAARGETIAAIVAAQSAAVQAEARGLRAGSPHGAPPPFVASIGVPALHAAPERAPRIPVAAHVALAPIAPPRTLDDLLALDAALAAEGETPRIAAATEEVAPPSLETQQLKALARDCLEEIAGMSMLREAADPTSWDEVARFESRLVRSLDALAALGVAGAGTAEPSPSGRGAIDVCAETVAYASELRPSDPGRAFTRSFVLACHDGEATARAAVLAVRAADPRTLAAHAKALALASSPHVAAAVAPLLMDARADLVVLGLDVLAARRDVPFGDVVPHLLHPSVAVVAAAARCLGVAAERPAAIAALEEALAAADDDRAWLAVVEALDLHGAPSGLAAVRERLGLEIEARGLEDERLVERAAELLATTGGAGDYATLRALSARSARLRRALGWLGSVAAVEPLLADLAALRASRPARDYPSPPEVATAEALHRLLGAELRVSPDDVPRTEVTTDLVLDARAWADVWARFDGRSAVATRVRFGRPWTPVESLAEVAGPARPRERALAARELAAVAGDHAHVDVTTWVRAQQVEIARFHEAVRAGAIPLRRGAWIADRRRSPARASLA